MTTAIRFENISKLYRLGEIGTGTLSHDLHRGWAKLRGKPDPFAKVGQVNDRANQNVSDSNAPDYVWALKNIDFEVKQGEILGIIGRNGAGKSTLLKLLSRVTAPTTGSIKAKGRIASLLEVGTGFHPELTGRENIYLNGAILGMQRHEITRKLEEIVDFSGCAKYIDTPVKRYSSGMTVRLGFAVAAHLDCEVLVVDEVLAVGDAEFQSKCIGKMQNISQGKERTVLFVSHNMGSISKLCHNCIVLSEGNLDHTGSVESAISKYLDEKQVIEKQFAINESQNFFFRSIEIVSKSNQSTTTIPYHHPINIKIKYTQNKTIAGMDIGLRVSSRTGNAIFTTTMRNSRDCELPNGTGEITVAIPSKFLAPGTYSIDLAAHIPNQMNIDTKSTALIFKVEETGSALSQYAGSESGVVTCQCSWEILHPLD